MILMRSDPLLGQVGGGWALEISRFFEPCMELAYLLDASLQGWKNSRFPGSHPLPPALVMDLHASKTLCMGPYERRCLNFVVFTPSPPQPRQCLGPTCVISLLLTNTVSPPVRAYLTIWLDILWDPKRGRITWASKNSILFAFMLRAKQFFVQHGSFFVFILFLSLSGSLFLNCDTASFWGVKLCENRPNMLSARKILIHDFISYLLFL